jgi:hypothetical protein
VLAIQRVRDMPDYTLESLTSLKLNERCYALSESVINETHLEQALVLARDDDEWGRNRIAASLRYLGSPFAGEALNLRKRPSPLYSEFDLVKWALLEQLTVGRFAKQATSLGFTESGRRFGLSMKGSNCEFVLSGRGLDCRDDAIIFSLVFKEGNQPARVVVDEGIVQFKVYPIDLELAERVAVMIVEHRSRVHEVSSNHRPFLSEWLSDDVARVLSLYLSPQAIASREDKESQSVAMVRGSVFYVLQTVPAKPSSAPDWFFREFGGYGMVLERCWNSQAFKRANSDVLCHIAVGCGEAGSLLETSGLWVNLSVFPMQSAPTPFPAILATDLLSPQELKVLAHRD